MSIFDENIEPKFEDLLESLGWYKTDQQWSVQSNAFGEDPNNNIYVNDVNELRIAIEAIKNKHKV